MRTSIRMKSLLALTLLVLITAQCSGEYEKASFFCTTWLTEIISSLQSVENIPNITSNCLARLENDIRPQLEEYSFEEIESFIEICKGVGLIPFCDSILTGFLINNYTLKESEENMKWAKKEIVETKKVHICKKEIWLTFKDDSNFKLLECMYKNKITIDSEIFMNYRDWFLTAIGEKFCDCEMVQSLLRVFSALTFRNSWDPDSTIKKRNQLLQELRQDKATHNTLKTWTDDQFTAIEKYTFAHKYSVKQVVMFLKHPICENFWGNRSLEPMDIMHFIFNKLPRVKEFTFNEKLLMAQWISFTNLPMNHLNLYFFNSLVRFLRERNNLETLPQLTKELANIFAQKLNTENNKPRILKGHRIWETIDSLENYYSTFWELENNIIKQ